MKIGLKTIDLLQRRALPTTYAGIKLDIEFTAPATPVTRVRTSAPIVTGGYMEGQDSACTTGFPVMRNDGVFGNISGDHCDDGTNNPWKWGLGGTLVMGISTGQADPGSTDLEIFLGTASGSFIPYIYTGNNNDSSNVLPIRGYYNAAVGDQLCHSGAYSGMVCGNELTSTGVKNCYEFLQCYWLGTTKQVSGLPSVGNGDSGGPAVAFAVRAHPALVGPLPPHADESFRRSSQLIPAASGIPRQEPQRGAGPVNSRLCPVGCIFGVAAKGP